MSAQFDSALRALESREDKLKHHYAKVEEATNLLTEGLSEKKYVEVSLRKGSYRVQFMATITVCVRGENDELELLVYEDIKVNDPRGKIQVVESILNKLIDALGNTFKEL